MQALAPNGEAPDSTEFALFDLGAQRIGVPSQYVVQAIAYPQQLVRLPRGRNALEGVFTHRGMVVPLLNVRHWMEQSAQAPIQSGPAQTGPRQVLILQAGDKVLAILIDALKGLLRVPAADQKRIHHDSDAEEFFHSVVLAEDRVSLICLLDPQRLAVQAQVWAGAAMEAADPAQALAQGPQSPGRGGAGTSTETLALVRLGSTLLALPVKAVGEVLGGLRVQRMAGLSQGFLGMAQWRARDLPVMDMAQLLGLSDSPARDAPWAVVLQWQDRALAFAVHEICAVRSLDASTLQDGTGLTEAMQRYCQGSGLTQAGERVYLLKPQAVLDACPLSTLTASSRSPQGGAKSAEALRLGYADHSMGGALVVFRSRQLWAAPIRGMREILSVPADLPTHADTGSALIGALEWRGQELELLDLCRLQGHGTTPRSTEARIIVTQQGSRTVGLLVESVTALVPDHAGTRGRFSTNGRAVDMVTVGSGEQQLSYQLMDLGQLACFKSPGGTPAHA